MADTTQKQLDIAGTMITLAGAIDDAYNAMEQALANKAQVPAFTDELLAGSQPTQHIEAADLETLAGRFDELIAWIDADGLNRRHILRKARR